jgi:hypothetical protein
MYETTIPNPPKGDYTAQLIATKDGKELGRQELKFTVIPPADEMFKLAAQPKTLADIANATGGMAYRLDQMPLLIDQLAKADTSTAKPKEQSVPLDDTLRAVLSFTGRPPNWDHKYDLPIQAAFIVLLLGFEWTLRRYWQLP